ncbi:MAG: hypothetical protein ACOYJ1_12250 [Peptococcales bacterium]|jgi:chaperonin cofactor prefoldin
MGFFWDLIQQNAIDEQEERTKSLEERVEYLEKELRKTQELLHKTLEALEKYTSKDIDGDGSIG